MNIRKLLNLYMMLAMILGALSAPLAVMAQEPATEAAPAKLDSSSPKELERAEAALAGAKALEPIILDDAKAILLSEDFETWPPPGWTIANNGGACVWESTATTARPNYAGGDGNAADADSDWCGSGTTMDTEMWTPVMDLVPHGGATLEFIAAYNDIGTGNGEVFEVDVSSNGGANWTNVLSWDEDHDAYGPGEVVSIDLAPFTSDQVVVRFHYVATGWHWWAEVDQFRVFTPQPNLGDSYKQAPSAVLTTDPIGYSIVVQNTGNLTATAAFMEDPIPAGTTYVPGSLACTSGACWYDAMDDTVYWQGIVDTTSKRAGIESIAGSDIVAYGCYESEIPATQCFSAYNASPDTEWIAGITLTLPVGWGVACNSQDPADSGGHAVTFACAAAGNVVSYLDSDGGYGEIYDEESWGFCVDITPTMAAGPQMIDYEMQGDIWGGDPHYISDTLSFNSCTGNPVDVTFQVDASGAACGEMVTNTAIISDPMTVSTVTVEAYTQMWAFIPFESDFEADDGGFVAGSGEWEWGTPTYPPGLTAHSGVNVWGTDLDGDVDDTIPSHALTRMIDVPDFPNVPIVLNWWDWNGAEAADYIRVAIDGTVVYEQYDFDQRTWTPHTVDLTPWRGQTVELMFELEACCSNPGPDGWYIDDVAILTCEPPADLYLGPDTVEVGGCVGVEQTHMFNLANWTGSDGTFNLTYSLDEPTWATLEGPASIYLANEASESFVVTLTPELCLPNNTVILGGVEASGGGYTDTSYITKTVVSGLIPEWQTAANTPQGTRYHAVAYADGALYQIGGETGWWISTTAVQKYDMATNTWSAAAALPVGIYGMDAVEIGGLIYVPGGSDDADDTGDGGTFLNTLNIYDPVANSWSTGAAMPAERAYASAVASGGLLYVIGGEDNTGAYVDTLYIYDPGTDSWSTGASMAQGRGYAAAAAIGGKIYVAGGFAGGTVVLDSMEIYDIATDSWTAGPDAPKSAGFYGDGTFANRFLIAYNGDAIDQSAGTTYSCSQDAYWYDTVGGAWHTLPLLNRCLYGSQGDGDGSSFYMVSGRTNEGGVWAMSPAVEYLGSCPECADVGWLEGYVYDYDGVNPTCNDAVVSLDPGGQVIPVDASGYYHAAVVPFDYDVMAEADLYLAPDGPYAVSVGTGVTATVDFILSRADNEVDPMSLSASAVAPDVVTKYITITNNGDLPLNYEIQEIDTGPAAEATPDASFLWLDGEVEIDPQVYAELDAAGATDFFVQLRQQADLSAADGMDWDARGWFVYNSLTAAAEAQSPIIAYAQANGLDYEVRLANNAVFIKGGSLADVDALAARADVYRIRANHVYELEDEQLAADPDAFGWNLDELDPNSNLWGMEAAQVWNQLGVYGEGVVVANIDTGAFYEHEALDRQYRGNLSGAIGGPYDHNYNWYMPTSGCGDGTYPCDNNSHGSGTMGIMVGENQDMSEQVGIAPAAKWIACKGCETTGCSDAALTGCADWMVAPCAIGDNPGDPSCNPDMRPHVINNSWGGGGCDLWYQGYIQAWVAAGIFPAFSAGNTVACSAVGSPGDTPEAFGTAAHDTTGQNVYAGGPSCHFPTPSCDPADNEVDPHISSPTFGRTSSNTAGAYFNLSGTSGASPHTAGCVALMWASNANLVGDVATTMTVLQETADRTNTAAWAAGDCGKPACAGADAYPNFEYGFGYLDCFAAVDAVFQADVDWIATDPVSGTLPSGDQVVEVTLTCDMANAIRPQPLQGVLRILNDDPCDPVVDVDITFNCTPGADLGKLEGLVWSTGYCDAENIPVGVPVVIEDGLGGMWTVPSDPTTGYYYQWLEAGTYTVTVTAPDHEDNVAVVDITGQQTTTHDVPMRLIESCMDVTPMMFSMTLPVDTQFTDTLSIVNNGAGDLMWEIQETTSTVAIELKLVIDPLAAEIPAVGDSPFSDAGYTAGPPTATGPTSPDDAVELILDDGTSENALGLTAGGQFIYLNRFTPDPALFPFTLQEVQHYFYTGQGVTVGDAFDVYIYEDTDGDGDPGTGAVFLGDIQDVTAQALDAWSVWPMPNPVVLNGPNDVLIALVNRTTVAPGTYPATMDQTASQVRSWIGAYAGDPGDPPTLPADNLWGIVDSFGFAGNWMVRGYGETGGGIVWLDVPWVSEVPTNGMVMGDDMFDVDVIFDSTGLTVGECYTASLGLLHDDPGWDNPTLIPLELCVRECIEVTGVELSVVNTDTIYVDTLVDFEADIMPDTFDADYNYTIYFDDGAMMSGSGSDDPLMFSHAYTETGTYTVTIEVWNCAMSVPVVDTIQVMVETENYYIYLPIVFKND